MSSQILTCVFGLSRSSRGKSPSLSSILALKPNVTFLNSQHNFCFCTMQHHKYYMIKHFHWPFNNPTLLPSSWWRQNASVSFCRYLSSYFSFLVSLVLNVVYSFLDQQTSKLSSCVHISVIPGLHHATETSMTEESSVGHQEAVLRLCIISLLASSHYPPSSSSLNCSNSWESHLTLLQQQLTQSQILPHVNAEVHREQIKA